ncbi:hypothetical protein ABKT86_23110, partial [Enterobacter hormaechei]
IFPDDFHKVLKLAAHRLERNALVCLNTAHQHAGILLREDPAVDNVTGFTGGSRVNSGIMFITLKPRGERHETAQQREMGFSYFIALGDSLDI